MQKMISDLDLRLNDLDMGIISNTKEKRSARNDNYPPDGPSGVSNEDYMGNPRRYRVLKKAPKKQMTKEEIKEHALHEIHQFYARQHIRRGLGFDELQ